MSSELIISSPATGLTVYAHVINQSGNYWNGTAFEAYTAGNYANYGTSLTENGSSGVYVGSFPTGITISGNYSVVYYSQAGGSPAQGTDTVIGSDTINWNGITTVSAAPTATLTSLVSEGLYMAGDSDPSDALQTRAEGNWIEEIKNDIWRQCKILKSLQTSSQIVFNRGQSLYAMPSDYAGMGEMSIRLLSGSHTGAVQSSTSSSVTLASSETATEEFIIGKEILITSGTAVKQMAQVISYNTSTKAASIYPSWTVNPVASDTYLIVERYKPLESNPVWDRDKLYYPNIPGEPCEFFPVGDESYSKFLLNIPPDKTYGAILRYYANIMTISTSGTLMATLYQKYRNLWIQGIFSRRLQDLDDDRAKSERQVYFNLLSDVVAQETYGMDIHTLQVSVSH